VGVPHIILKVDQHKITAAKVSEKKNLIGFFPLKICIISINNLKEKLQRKAQIYVELLVTM
jgi:hypothetical protein